MDNDTKNETTTHYDLAQVAAATAREAAATASEDDFSTRHGSYDLQLADGQTITIYFNNNPWPPASGLDREVLLGVLRQSGDLLAEARSPDDDYTVALVFRGDVLERVETAVEEWCAKQSIYFPLWTTLNPCEARASA